jgi:hypothetical protein
MDTAKPIDQDRRFIISYFLSDDTLLVFEPPVRKRVLLTSPSIVWWPLFFYSRIAILLVTYWTEILCENKSMNLINFDY